MILVNLEQSDGTKSFSHLLINLMIKCDTEIQKSQIFPARRRATMCIVTFTATHSGRTREHRHLFMLPNQSVEQDMPVTTGNLPIDEWTHYLEHGDVQIDGAGWGSIKMRGIDYVPASLLPQ